jgi:hypothetical protein
MGQSPGIQILDLRLSFIWVETVLDLIRDPVPSSAPLAFLGRSDQYIPLFDKTLQSGMGPEGLQLPWVQQEKGRQFLWSYYLSKPVPGHVSGGQAWKALVPFRGKVPATVEAPWLPGRVVLEAFFYPHGLAFIATAVCQACPPPTLEEAVENAFEVRRTGRFQVRWDEGGASESLPLDVLADKGLAALRKFALGPGAGPGPGAGAGPLTPFTVVTVVRGTSVDRETPAPDGGEVHRALHAMTTWSPYWRGASLPSLDEASLQIKGDAPDNHVLYGRTRGRAVWFPQLFNPETKGRHRSLSCYHRNLVLVSLHVESLSGLVSETAKHIRDGKMLSVGSHDQCARRAVGILSRLYGGVKNDNYRSWSPRAHIEQNEFVTAVNEVRDFCCNLPPLSS